MSGRDCVLMALLVLASALHIAWTPGPVEAVIILFVLAMFAIPVLILVAILKKVSGGSKADKSSSESPGQKEGSGPPPLPEERKEC